MSSGGIALGVNAFVTLLAAAVLISILAERLRIPAPVLLVGSGVIARTFWNVHPPFAFGPGLLFVFLPPLIFEAAWNLDLRELRRYAGYIALLAFPGTLFTAFAIGSSVAGTGALPFGGALLLGAMVAATDPVAVVAVFRKVGAPVGVRTIVEGESLANDGVAVVLYGIALTLAQGGQVEWVRVAAHGVLAVIGGTVIGVLIGVVVWRLLRLTEAAEYEVTVTVAMAYIAYLVADRLQLSGIFATAASGVLLRFLAHTRSNVLANVEDADRFWNAGAFIVNALVFLSTGLLIDFQRMLNEPLLIVASLVVVFVSRAALVWAIVREWRAGLTIFVAGMRGALPLALAISLPDTLPYRAEIIDAVFAIVFVTLVVQGLPLAPLVHRLYGPGQRRIGGPEPSS